MKIEAQVTIQNTLKEVFAVFCDLEKAEERIQSIKKIEILNPPAMMQIGTKWRETRVMFGKEATEVMWVTELNPEKNYVVDAESHGAHYRSEYTFEKTDGGILVVMVFESKPLTFVAKLLSVLFFFFAGATKKALLQDMYDLKKVLES